MPPLTVSSAAGTRVEPTASEPVPLRVLRWSARISSLVSVATVLLFAIGNRFSLFALTMRDALLFLLFPIGMCVGLVLGWWRSGLGGAITMGSLAGFYIVHRIWTSVFPSGWAFVVLAIPGFLFLGCWFWTRLRAVPRDGEETL